MKKANVNNYESLNGYAKLREELPLPEKRKRRYEANKRNGQQQPRDKVPDAEYSYHF